MFYLEGGAARRPNTQHALREKNLKQLFNIVNRERDITRAELVRRSGLSPSTVSSLVNDLVRAGLIEELGLAQPSAASGRRPILLSVGARGRQIPVFSLSDCGVSYALYDLGYNVLDRVFRPYLSEARGAEAPWGAPFRDAGADYAAIIAEVLERQSPHFDRRRAPALLISYPGIYLAAERQFLLTSTSTSFRPEALAGLTRRTGLPVFIGNSSASLAYAEKKRLDDDGVPAESLVFVNICSGVGAGIVTRDDIAARPGDTAGEIGHMTIEMNGRPCACGCRGCLEQYVNLNAILAEVRAAVARDDSGRHPDALRALLSETTLEGIRDACARGIPSVVEAMGRVADWLAAGIRNVVNVTGIKRIVIGGIEALGDDFLEALRRRVGEDAARFLMRGVEISYARTRPESEGLGIAQYFIDKVLTVAEDVSPRAVQNDKEV